MYGIFIYYITYGLFRRKITYGKNFVNKLLTPHLHMDFFPYVICM